MNTLTRFQREGLEEIGNIVAGKAATILSYLCEEKFITTLSEIQFIPTAQLSGLWKESENQMVCNWLHLMGEVMGKSLILFSSENGLYLVNKVIKDRFHEATELTEADLLELKKISEMVANAYFDAISSFLNIALMPYLSEISAGNIQSCLNQWQKDRSDYVLVIQSTFNRAPFLRLWGSFFFVFDEDILKVILPSIRIIEKIGYSSFWRTTRTGFHLPAGESA